MLDAIRGFVTRNILRPAPESGGTAATPSAGNVQLAACALLLELAWADGEFSADERAHIESAIGRHFGLDDAVAQELIALAETERSRSIDHFQFTRLIAAEYDLGQKMVLAEVMWGVILADGRIADHEAYLARKLGNLLELEPAYLAQARRAATPPD
jgi:uncharacterized tellurite resistance protein B-like protein